MWEKESKSKCRLVPVTAPANMQDYFSLIYVIKPLEAEKLFSLLLLQHFLNILTLGVIMEIVELKIKTTELLKKKKILKKLLTLLTIISHGVFVYFSPCS